MKTENIFLKTEIISLNFSQRWNCRLKEKLMLAGKKEDLLRIPKDTVTPRMIISEQASSILTWLIIY